MAREYKIEINTGDFKLTTELFNDLRPYSIGEIRYIPESETLCINFYEHDDEVSFGLTLLKHFDPDNIDFDGLGDHLISHFAKETKE